MISGIDLMETKDFVCEDDKKDPTIWKIGFMPSFLLARIMTRAKEKQTESLYEIVSAGLRGWENFKIKDKLVEYKTEEKEICGQKIQCIPSEIINTIPFPVVVELSAEIMTLNQLSEKERKN